MKRILLILAIFIAGLFIPPSKPVEILKEGSSAEISRVTRVVDGDTIELEGGKRVRYIGINTPELETHDCFSKEASDKNKQLVEGKTVRLVGDTGQTDTYGRLLRYVYVEDVFINDTLVRQGFARAEPIKPDTRYAKEFAEAQQEARENNRGLWSGCPG